MTTQETIVKYISDNALAYGRPSAAATIVDTLLSERPLAPVKMDPPDI
jgi:hypothetical protein